MKIFDWVQKRLHQNVLKAKSFKKSDSMEIDNNTEALRDQVAFVDVLDGWKDGILTIGTFGFDSLNSSSYAQQQTFHYDPEQDFKFQVELEQFPAGNNNNNNNTTEIVEEEEANPLLSSKSDDKIHNEIEVVECDIGVGKEPTEGKKERITLADLFLANPDKEPKIIVDPFEESFSKKFPVYTKNRLSFAKKLIRNVGDNKHSVKKLNQMMKRMLKKKIHPDLQGKAQKSENLVANMDMANQPVYSEFQIQQK